MQMDNDDQITRRHFEEAMKFARCSVTDADIVNTSSSHRLYSRAAASVTTSGSPVSQAAVVAAAVEVSPQRATLRKQKTTCTHRLIERCHCCF